MAFITSNLGRRYGSDFERRAMRNMSKTNSVTKDTLFVHSGFRTSSTWLWLKLRELEGIRAYYEPFNQVLASMSKLEAARLGPGTWNSHHPVSDPYFLEFIELLTENGGIKQFEPEMAFERHIPMGGVDGDLSGAEIGYLNLLIESAHELGRRAALCDTRSLGRSRAIKKEFGGTHVLLTRNLHEQWCSFAEQAADGDNSFFESVFHQIEFGKHDPFLRRLAEIIEKRAENSDAYENYVFFLLSQLYLNAVAFDVCKIKIDVSKMANCSFIRADTETRLSQALNSCVDLSDVKAHVSFSSLEAKSRNPAEKLARQLLTDMSIPNASVECEEFVQRAFADAFKCWDQSIYFGDASRTFLSKRVDIERKRAADESARAKALERQLQDLHLAAHEASKDAEAAHRDAAQAHSALRQHVVQLVEQLTAESSDKEDALRQLAAEHNRSIFSIAISRIRKRFFR